MKKTFSLYAWRYPGPGWVRVTANEGTFKQCCAEFQRGLLISAAAGVQAKIRRVDSPCSGVDVQWWLEQTREVRA